MGAHNRSKLKIAIITQPEDLVIPANIEKLGSFTEGLSNFIQRDPKIIENILVLRSTFMVTNTI